MLHVEIRASLLQLQKRFCIVTHRQLVKRSLNKCNSQGFLPKDQVSRADSFLVTRIHFNGPLLAKPQSRTVDKVLIFTFVVTCSLHLVLVNYVTTHRSCHDFANSYRDGDCSWRCNDNALTFKSSSRELKKLWRVMEQPQEKILISKSSIMCNRITESPMERWMFWETRKISEDVNDESYGKETTWGCANCHSSDTSRLLSTLRFWHSSIQN